MFIITEIYPGNEWIRKGEEKLLQGFSQANLSQFIFFVTTSLIKKVFENRLRFLTQITVSFFSQTKSDGG